VSYRIGSAPDITSGAFQLFPHMTASDTATSLNLPAGANRLFHRVVPVP
jgi:hypothetical protein